MTRTLPAPESNRELHPKRWVVLAFTALPVCGIALGYAFDNFALPYLKDWWRNMNDLDPSGAPLRNAIILAAPLAFMAATGLATTAYLWLMAFRILQSKTFPPRGYLIIAKTTVLGGRPAAKKGYELLIFGALSIALTTYVIWSIFVIFPDAIRLLRPLYG
jgi:hypothetical protein